MLINLYSGLSSPCVECHMKQTPPPDVLAYNSGGLNHTFYAEKGICADCHQTIDAEDVQGPTEEKMDELKALIASGRIERELVRGDAEDLFVRIADPGHRGFEPLAGYG